MSSPFLDILLRDPAQACGFMAFWGKNSGALKSRRSRVSWRGEGSSKLALLGVKLWQHVSWWRPPQEPLSLPEAVPSRSQGLHRSAGWATLTQALCLISVQSLWVSPNSLNSETWDSPAQAPYKVNREENISVGQLRLLSPSVDVPASPFAL